MMKQTGFTLLEVLIAMTLLGLLMVMLYQTLSLGAKSWNVSEKRVAEVSEMRDAYRFLRQQIERIQPTPDIQGPEDERKFLGREDRLTFVANVPENIGLSGPGLHTLSVEEDNGASNLVLKMSLDHPDSEWALTHGEDDSPYPLIQGASEIKFAYFGARNLGNTPDWFDRWEGENIPSIIKLSVTFSESQVAWPDLLVAIKIDTNTQPILSGQRGSGGRGNVPISAPGQ